jgi:hypothetical protein
VLEVALDQPVKAAEEASDHGALLAIVVGGMLESLYDEDIATAALKRRQLALLDPKHVKLRSVVHATLRNAVDNLLSEEQIRGLGVELALQTLRPATPNAVKEANAEWRNFLKALGVKLDKLEAQAATEAKAADKAKPAKARKAAKPSAAPPAPTKAKKGKAKR